MNASRRILTTLRIVLACIVEVILVGFVIMMLLKPVTCISRPYALLIILFGVAISNFASAEIVGFVKDRYLWGKVPKAVRVGWKSNSAHYSNISYELGIVQRIVLVLAGASSIQLFWAAVAGWTTFLVAVDWRPGDNKHRVIGHIYAISVTLSSLLAFVDVLAVRALLGLPLLK